MTDKKELNGILLVNKPEAYSSNKIVNIVKKSLAAKKAGHTGTLDPFATGLLPVCINKGTKQVRYLIGKNKEYTGTIKLGIKTDTLDKTGKITEEKKIPDLSHEFIIDTCRGFTGEINQIPPSFSALKLNGVPLYKHARQGNFIEKEPRKITIHELEVIDINIPFIDIRVKCSAGTYIRTLASDIAEKLETCGHLHALERTMCGELSLDQGLPLEKITEKNFLDEIDKHLIPMEKIVDFMPEITIEDSIIPDIFNGKKIYIEDIANNMNIIENIPIRIMSKEKKLISIVRKENGLTFFKYDVVFN